MYRDYMIALFFLLAFLLPGCSVLEYFDGSPTKDSSRYRASREGQSNEMRRLQMENEDLKRQITSLARDNQQIRSQTQSEIAKMEDKTKFLNDQVIELQKVNQRMTEEDEILKEKLAKIQPGRQPLSPQSVGQERDQEGLKIKVLTGDGDMNTAKEVALKLTAMGYDIKGIDYASRSNFSANTVYFNKNSKVEAERLADGLGQNMVLKPLNWSSIFDIIVVTVKGR